MGTLAIATLNAMLDARFGGGTPAAYYLAAFVSSSEVTAGDYARLTVNNNATNFPAASGGVKTNGVGFSWPRETAEDWGTVDEIRIYDASTGGNLVASDALSTPRAVQVNDVFEIPAGDLTITAT